MVRPVRLTSDQLEAFDDDGYLIIEDFYDTEKELEPVKVAINDLVEMLAERLLNAGKIQDSCKDADMFSRMTLIDRQYPGATILLHRLGVFPPAFRDLFSNERMLNIMEQLLGPDIAGHSVWSLRPKIPRTEAHDVPWHQDVAYLEQTNPYAITVWTPLVDADETNGCLQLLKGGHKSGKIGPHKGCWKDTWYVYMDEEDLEVFDVDVKANTVTCPVRYGGVVIFNNRLPHLSLPNRSQKIRWSIDLRWHNANVPCGFVKPSVVLRKKDEPNYRPDWNTFVQSNFHKKGDNDFDTRNNPEHWMKRWPLVNENRHIALWKKD